MTTLADSPVDGSSSAVGGEAGRSATASAIDGSGLPGSGVAGGATGAIPAAVQSFTEANGAAFQSLLSQQAVDPVSPFLLEATLGIS